jgi:uncharacterized membrane protein YbhN (UPF0104 family)
MRELGTGRGARIVRWLLALLVLAACGWYFASRIDHSALLQAFAGADYRLVVAAALSNLALYLPLKAWRWKLMLDPVARVPLAALYNYNAAGYAASNVLPARVGEVVRVLLLRRRGVPLGGAIGVQVLEKIYNTVALALVILPLPWTLPLLPAEARTALVVVSAGALIGTAIMFWLARHGRLGTGWLARVGEGIALLRDPGRAAAALALSLAIWVIDVAVHVALTMAAVGMQPTFWGAALVLLLVNVAIAAPSTPGQLGLFEAGAVAGCMLLGSSREQGLAFGILYHMMQVIPVTAYGGVILARSAVTREAKGGQPGATLGAAMALRKQP